MTRPLTAALSVFIADACRNMYTHCCYTIAHTLLHYGEDQHPSSCHKGGKPLINSSQTTERCRNNMSKNQQAARRDLRLLLFISGLLGVLFLSQSARCFSSVM